MCTRTMNQGLEKRPIFYAVSSEDVPFAFPVTQRLILPEAVAMQHI